MRKGIDWLIVVVSDEWWYRSDWKKLRVVIAVARRLLEWWMAARQRFSLFSLLKLFWTWFSLFLLCGCIELVLHGVPSFNIKELAKIGSSKSHKECRENSGIRQRRGKRNLTESNDNGINGTSSYGRFAVKTEWRVVSKRTQGGRQSTLSSSIGLVRRRTKRQKLKVQSSMMWRSFRGTNRPALRSGIGIDYQAPIQSP